MHRSWLMALLSALAFVLMAQPPLHAEEPEYQQSIAQAKVYMKAERYREAVQELRRALSTKQGDKSFEAHLMYAQASFKTYDISQAVEFARLASELTSDPRELSQAEDLSNYLTLAFGKVEFVAGEGELREGYLIITPLEPMLDVEVQGYFDTKVKPLFDQKRSLPWVMWLPTMLFEINGKEFSVIPGENTTVEAGFTAEIVAAQEATVQKMRDAEMSEERRREAASFNTELRVGYAAVPMGLRRDDGAVTGFALDLLGAKEFGPFGVGGFVTGTLSDVSNKGVDSPSQSSPDLMVGALARVRVFMPGRLSLFPALGVAWGTVGGASVTCDSATSAVVGDRLTYSDCSAAADPSYASPFEAYTRVAGFGPVGRLDFLIERPPGLALRGVFVGVHAAALMASPFREASRTNEVMLSDDGGQASATTVVEELNLADVGGGLVIRAGLMVGARLAF